MSCAEGGRGGRGGRRSTKRSSPRMSRKVKFEPPPSPIRVASTGPRAEAVGVEERLDVLLHDQRWKHGAMLCPMRRRLYLLRHAEVSYVGERDPETVRLTERGREQAAAARAALEGVEVDLLVTSSLPRTVETAALVAPGRRPEQWARVRRVAWRPARRARACGARACLRRCPAHPRGVGAVPRRRIARRSARPRPSGVRTARRTRVEHRARRLSRWRQPDPSLAGACRRPLVLQRVRAGAGVHQRARCG